MKKILSILLCLALLGCAALAEPVAAESAPAVGEKLGFELLKELYAEGGNVLLSPASLTLALGMAAEGAEGETLTAILTALGAENASELGDVVPEEIKSANAAFVAQGLLLKGDYIDRLNEAYGAEWFELDAEVVEVVNAWVAEHTDGLIEKLLSQAPDPQTGLILINAIAMDAKWEKPFKDYNTIEDDFHATQGDVSVEMMYQREFFDYVERDGLQIVRLPYAGGALEMWIALPGEGVSIGLDGLLDALAEQGMDYLKDGAEEREVDLFLPKFDLTTENSLSDALKVLGLELPFSENADFSGISEVPLRIDEILQKVRVQLDEEGTKAAAATAAIVACMALIPEEEPVEVRADRPFAFVIADAETDGVCFAGVVENPVE